MFEKTYFRLGFALSVASSLGGIVLGVLLPGRTADAGRGGAVGTAIALTFLFINRDYGPRYYNAISKQIPALKELFDKWEREKNNQPRPSTPPLELPELQQRVDALAASIALEGQGHLAEAQYMAVATALGTIAWGFGDWFAQGLLYWHWVVPLQHAALQYLCNFGFNF